MELLILLIIVVLLIPLSMLWPPDSPWSWKWRTSDKIALKMAEMAKVRSSDIVYDLGSGDAKPLITVVKKHSCRAVGIEIDPIRFWISKLTVLVYGQSSRIKLIRGNLFKEDISKATVVFVYLIPRALDDLLPKLLSEASKGTRIVSKTYEIDLPLSKKDKENNLFYYVI